MRLQKCLAQQVIERIRLSEQIEDAIASVEDERLRLLLRYRYIEGWTWEHIAVELNYSWRQVVRIHGQALSEVKMS